MMEEFHIPVLLKEILEIFNPQPGQIYIDATVNGGGHARAIAQRLGAGGKVVGIDQDCELVKKLRMANQQSGITNIDAVCGNYKNIKDILRERGTESANGILFDLGFSSYHIEQSGRGFSFLKDEPLDMRYDPNTNDITASGIINTWSGEAIAALLRDSGEERFALRIARAVVREREQKPIKRTGELVSLIVSALPRARGKARIHPATRTFQALRIAVNHELESIAHGMNESLELLRPGGKIIVISFHSLEDRIVKQTMRRSADAGTMQIITPKPVRPSRNEMSMNSRARSAKLRVAQKL